MSANYLQSLAPRRRRSLDKAKLTKALGEAFWVLNSFWPNVDPSSQSEVELLPEKIADWTGISVDDVRFHIQTLISKGYISPGRKKDSYKVNIGVCLRGSDDSKAHALPKLSPAANKSKHPATAKFVRFGIFKNLKSFRDLEKR